MEPCAKLDWNSREGNIRVFGTNGGSVKVVARLAWVVGLAGCGSLSVSRIGMPEAAQTPGVVVVDMRTEPEKSAHRSGVLSSSMILGNANFDVSPVLHVKSALARQRPPGLEAVRFELRVLRLTDDFSGRMSEALPAALTGASGHVAAGRNGPGMDSIHCEIEGVLNGIPVSGAASVPYRTNPLAVSVRNDPAWTGAVRESIQMAVAALYGGMELR